MDTYLDIAAEILRAQRRPLSSEAILREAYRNDIVPTHLHGRTQHKTLHARIAEDILRRGEHSLFMRTSPGRFFLREFLTDPSLPEDFRHPFPARRRFRELARGPALAINAAVLRSIAKENTVIDARSVLDLLQAERYKYEDPKDHDEHLVFLRSFVCVTRANSLLTYRLGRYREDRDNFLARRSIGFWTFVHRNERTLFNMDSFGIVDAGVHATKIDLDIPEPPKNERMLASLCCFIWSYQHEKHRSDLLALIRFECPKWFEPTKRRLAINDLAWIDTNAHVNNLDDFDPWSQMVLLEHYRSEARLGGCFASDSARAGQADDGVSQVSG